MLLWGALAVGLAGIAVATLLHLAHNSMVAPRAVVPVTLRPTPQLPPPPATSNEAPTPPSAPTSTPTGPDTHSARRSHPEPTEGSSTTQHTTSPRGGAGSDRAGEPERSSTDTENPEQPDHRGRQEFTAPDQTPDTTGEPSYDRDQQRGQDTGDDPHTDHIDRDQTPDHADTQMRRQMADAICERYGLPRSRCEAAATNQ